MDDMATASSALIAVIFGALFLVTIASIILATLDRIKREEKKVRRLKSNLILVGTAYLIMSTVFYFISGYGKFIAAFILPGVSIFTLILLEITDFLRKTNS